MSVLVTVRVPATAFQLGQALRVDVGERIELETLVPLGESAIPFCWVYHSDPDGFVETANGHPAVDRVSEIEAADERTLFALDWESEADGLVRAITESDGQLLDAAGAHAEWRLDLRFRDHERLSAFRSACQREGIPLAVERVYHAGESGGDAPFGLTAVQCKTLVTAVERGYYDIPRGCTTTELAEGLGVSDQAVTERLRRGIVALVTNALVASDDGE